MMKKNIIAVAAALSLAFGVTGAGTVSFTRQAAAETRVVDTTSKVAILSSPAEIDDAVAKDNGLLNTIPKDGEDVESFTISERGWLVVKLFKAREDHEVMARLYSNASLTRQLGEDIYVGYYKTEAAISVYVEPGTYYINHPKTYMQSSIFAAFIPTSKVLNVSQESISNGTKITASASSAAKFKIMQDNLSVEKIKDKSWDDTKVAKEMTDGTYTTSTAGNYTIKAEFTEDVWKDYPAMVDITVSGQAAPAATTAPTAAPAATTAPTAAPAATTAPTAAPAATTAPAGDIVDNNSDDEINSITFKNAALNMTVGDEKKLAYTTDPSDIEADDLEWKSSDDDVVEVDDYGKVTAVSAGVAKITVQSEDGEVSDTMQIAVNPEGMQFKSVKTTKKKITLKWERVDGVSGYQINYGLKSDFKGAKSKTTAAKTTTAALTKLKSKKTYYVRIRTYQTVGGKKYYSEWSKINSIKVK